MLRTVILNLSILLASLQCLGQASNPVLSNGALVEKVYLQTDATLYTLDQNMWFKALVVSGVNNKPTQFSGVLYVELVGEDGSIKDRKLVQIEAGVGEGFFELELLTKPGRYQLRAYTHWNKNFEDLFVYQQYVDVYSSKVTELPEIFEDVTLITKDEQIQIQALIRLDELDMLPENPTLKLGLGNVQDSILLDVSGDGTYLLNYVLPETTGLLQLSFEDDAGKRYSKNILVNPDLLDLQFFPESGELVSGMVSKVGFKSLGLNGLGKEISGQIINSNGQEVTSFKSNSLGMGSFTMLAGNKQYFAKLKSEIDPNLSLKYELPKVAERGTVMSVLQQNNFYTLNVSSNVLKKDSVLLIAAMQGVEYLRVPGRLSEEGQLRFKIPSSSFKEGVLAFTLRDRNGDVILNRLVFNQSDKQQMNISVTSDQDTYQQRQMSQITTSVTDLEGNPIKANLSYLVVNKSQMGELQQNRHNIRSYLLMGSELKGNIESPGYYFRADTDHAKDLDALLLTQGWSKYKYQDDLPFNNLFRPEYSLTVSGTVNDALNKKRPKKGVEVSLMSFGENSNAYTQKSDSLGRFYFEIGSEYGESMDVLIQTANARGKNKNYKLTIDENIPPVVNFDPFKPLVLEDSVERLLIEKNRERRLINEAYRPDDFVRDLGEVVVEDYELTPERNRVVEVHGLPDLVITGKELEEKSQKWSSGIYSILAVNYPNDIRIRRLYSRTGSFEIASVQGADITLVTIDGIPVMPLDYPRIGNIPESEIKSFELLKRPKNFHAIFYELFPQSRFFPERPAIIAIYTHAKKGIFNTRKTPGIFNESMQVFSPTQEFYQPKYEKLTPQDWVKPDYRAVIHWQPLANTDANGKSTTSFFNADQMDDMLVVVEAIAEDGSIGYQEYSYRVVKREDKN